MEQNTDNMPDVAKKKVGTIEPKKNTLEPKQVEIIAIKEQTEKSDQTKMKKPLVNVQCKHPDKDELINISKIKILSNDKIFVKSLWVVEDEDNNFQKGGAIDDLLKFMKKDCLADCYNCKIETVAEDDDKPFLCLKAY